jgi:hypothetical protein
MNYKEIIPKYIKAIPDDSIIKALNLCKEYVEKVMNTEIWELERYNCTDTESRKAWQTEMEYRDRLRSQTHNALIQAMLAANKTAKNNGLASLFPIDEDTSRQVVGDIAGTVVTNFFENRKR